MLGASLTFAFAPFGQWYLVFIVLPLSFYILAFSSPHIGWSTWWFGLGYFGAGLSWVHVSIAEFGGVPLIVSVILMLLLSGYLALFPVFAFKVLKRFFPTQYWPLAMGFVWLVMEYLRAHFLTGFPWLSIAYSQSSSPLSSLLPIIGEIGLAAVIVVVCISISIGFSQKRFVLSLIPLFVLFASSLALSGVEWTKETGESRKIVLVQGNIPQSMRFEPERDKATMEKYLGLSKPHWDADIIIWPEAAVPRLEVMVEDYLKYVDNIATQSNTGLITGVVDYNLSSGIAYNTLLSLGIDQTSNNVPYQYKHSKRYAKHHLLPIGEFVPFETLLRPLAPIFDLPMSSFSRGEYVQNNLIAGNTYFVPVICFEIAFPNQIRENITSNSNMILTVSNDAWFGDSHGPHQHMQIAQVRAKEFGLPLVRATNNGVSVAVDHKGNIIGRLPQFVDDSIEVDVALVKGHTPYKTFGDLPIWIFMSLMCLIAITLHRKHIK